MTAERKYEWNDGYLLRVGVDERKKGAVAAYLRCWDGRWQYLVDGRGFYRNTLAERSDMAEEDAKRLVETIGRLEGWL